MPQLAALRVSVSVAMLSCAALLAFPLADPGPRDWNDIWEMEPIRTLDQMWTPRSFFFSPRVQCNQNLKQINLCLHVVILLDGAESASMEIDEPTDVDQDCTLDHLW
jgi:hypothetical protein